MRRIIALLVLFFTFSLPFKIQAQSTAGTNNADLNGSYAFSFDGFSGNGTVASAFAAVGRFTADGAGHLTSGELITNGPGVAAVSAQPFTGIYSIGADHRGVMTLNTSSGSATLAFAMTASGNAQIIEFDAAGGAGKIGSGTLEKSDPTAYSAARITGDYAFGAAGFDNVNNRAAIEGRFTSNGADVLTNAAGDVNAYGTAYTMLFSAINYSVTDTTTGRGTMHMAFTLGGTADTLTFAFYIVNSGKLFLMESDAVTPATPLLSGVVVQQHTPSAGFSNPSLNGNSVMYLSGTSNCGSSGSSVPKAVAGMLTTNGSGALSLTYDENYCRAPNFVANAAGTYSVASNGRTTMAIGGYSLVSYLVNSNQMMLFVSDANVLFGFAEPQTGVSFNNSALSGPYSGFASHPTDFAVSVFSGEFAADGAASTGNLFGAEDIGAASGPVSGAAFRATYSISASPTNGRGNMIVSSGVGGSAVIYMISPTNFVAVSQTDPNPAILLFEQSLASVAPSVAIASLSLSPVSVRGGTSATGTLTLSGPAPAGGAIVTIASSNAAVARVPVSVAVAAGATSASFGVTTSAVASSATVTISGAYGGFTRIASLTVNAPPPPPPPSLVSLTLNPSSVLGGLQSSSGTVTISQPAPASGVLVQLYSSGPASVPLTVVIPAGSTSAGFTLSAPVVLFPATATISASYNGTTRTATLSVLL